MILKFNRDQASDSGVVVTPFIQEATNQTRDFGTLGPLLTAALIFTPFYVGFLFQYFHCFFLLSAMSLVCSVLLLVGQGQPSWKKQISMKRNAWVIIEVKEISWAMKSNWTSKQSCELEAKRRSTRTKAYKWQARWQRDYAANQGSSRCYFPGNLRPEWSQSYFTYLISLRYNLSKGTLSYPMTWKDTN